MGHGIGILIAVAAFASGTPNLENFYNPLLLAPVVREADHLSLNVPGKDAPWRVCSFRSHCFMATSRQVAAGVHMLLCVVNYGLHVYRRWLAAYRDTRRRRAGP